MKIVEKLKEIKIPEYLEELNNKYKVFNKDIIFLENSLLDYKMELEQLQKKYNVKTIEEEIREQKSLQYKIYLNILRAKYKYVADLVYSVLDTELFTSYNSGKKESEKFFKWLFNTYGIKYENYYHFIEFKTFYKDYIDINYESIDIDYDNVLVEVYAEYYFRGACEDKVKFIIPISTLNKINVLTDEFKKYIEVIIKEKEETDKTKAIKNEQLEYAQFLRLKEKFENNKSAKLYEPTIDN